MLQLHQDVRVSQWPGTVDVQRMNFVQALPEEDFLTTVTVVMPSYNAERTVEQAVRSVLSQTFTGWELLIVDDGSVDGSPAILRRLAEEDSRIRVLRNPEPTGASAARNFALSEATGRYITFLDSDDAWLPHKLALQLKAMQASGAALSCGAYHVMDGEGAIIGQVQPHPGIVTYRSLLFNNAVGCLTAMIDRAVCGDVRFDPKLPRGEDYQLWLSVLKQGAVGVCVPDTLALYRVHGKTLSSNKLSSARTRWLIYREYEHQSILMSAFYFTAYAVTGVLKSLAMRKRRALHVIFGRG